MASPGTPINYATLSSYNTKLKKYNDERFVINVDYIEDMKNKMSVKDIETEPIDFKKEF